MTEPFYPARPDGLRLAYRHRPGHGPTLIFLPGYMSDMEGGKATALDAWAETNGRAMLRLDYSGCGVSEGEFVDRPVTQSRDDALFLIETMVVGPFVLIGFSKVCWLAWLVVSGRPGRLSDSLGLG